MQLWNDYEGRTIAEAYPLEKLLSPEGRSAFFSTHNGTGTPAVIRLIEPHFDEAEILERWRQIAEMQEPHLIAIRKYGQAELDGASVVYAVMEPSDDSLAEILKQRALTPEETREIATSLVSALTALHSRGLVHEHVAPASVLAVGEVIKLRSDCVRELPKATEENQDDRTQEAAALRGRDVHDLAVTLLQALTLRQTLPGTSMPTPFDAIIRNGISGKWGLAEIATALTPAPAPTPRIPVPSATAPPVAGARTAGTPVQNVAPKPATSPAAAVGRTAAGRAAAAPVAAAPVATIAPKVRDRLVRPVEDMPAPSRGRWIAGGGVALLLLILIFAWRHFSSTPAAAPAPVTTLATPDQPTAVEPPAKPAASAPVKPVPAPRSTGTRSATAAGGHDQWRVVVYTFNHQDQAEKRAELLKRRFASFHPGVFSPNGRAPFLVILGGPLSREQATTLRNQARAAGLPRDTYTQNYSH